MWKNIGKGGIWFAIYFGLQNIVSTVYALIYVLMNMDAAPDFTDFEATLDFVLEAIIATAVPALIISALLMIIIYIAHRNVTKQPLYSRTAEWQKVLFFAGVAAVLNVVFNLLMSWVATMMPESLVSALEGSVEMVTTGQSFWVLLLGTGILVPVMEEITFRYGIHHHIAKSNLVWAYIISSVIFGLMHGNPLQIVYATIFGLILAFVYQKTDNLIYPIVIHAVNNSMSLCASLFSSDLGYVITVAGGGLVLALGSYFCCKNVKEMLQKSPKI